MGCEGCEQSMMAQQMAIATVRIQAVKYAARTKKEVIIYQQPDGSFDFMEADKARQIGIPAIQYISRHYNAHAR